MKLPIARPSLAPVVSSLTRPPIKGALPAARPAVPVKVGEVPPEIIAAALEAEYNNDLKSRAGTRYDTLRATITDWMKKAKCEGFKATGKFQGRAMNLYVTLEDTSKSKVDLDLLMKFTKLSLAQLHAKGILSSSAKAITDALGAQAGAQATVPGKPNIQARFKELA